MKIEPRDLLEKDSICYKCQYYKHISDIDDIEYIHKDNIDENGGMCDCDEMCVCGHLNNYEGE